MFNPCLQLQGRHVVPEPSALPGKLHEAGGRGAHERLRASKAASSHAWPGKITKLPGFWRLEPLYRVRASLGGSRTFLAIRHASEYSNLNSTIYYTLLDLDSTTLPGFWIGSFLVSREAVQAPEEDDDDDYVPPRRDIQLT